MELDLPLILAGVIGFGVFMYVLMDGFDLGVGILFLAVPGDDDRDAMMNSVAPIWDGNETWLVLGGTALIAAFPLAYAVILPALYLPVLLMLIALIFRGVAFEFRFKARRSRHFWNWAFSLGSILATFAQGVVLGAFVHGFTVEDRQFAGGPLDWLTPFGLATGLAMIAGYALLGSTWLIMKTEGPLQSWAYRITPGLLILVLAFMGLVSLWVPFLDTDIAERWFAWPNLAYLSPVPVLTLLTAFALYRSVQALLEVMPFLLAMTLFVLGYAGLVISLWPNVIPPDISIWEAASPPETQAFLLVGLVVLVPIILAYTAWSYWIFRGKVSDAAGYH
jgi:cytochrome bd ubiquinol oxidase subunit II